MLTFVGVKQSCMEVFEPLAPYGKADDVQSLTLINMVRNGVQFGAFDKMANKCGFSMAEWSEFLHLSERSMQRYRKENKSFDPLQSEKILEIALLFNRGVEVFGNIDKFIEWLGVDNIVLGNIKPKSLLDNSFGINLLREELTRIEHGILS
jgi:putative toxin-antitoxin system antitoxin component (TIGR02293 family)